MTFLRSLVFNILFFGTTTLVLFVTVLLLPFPPRVMRRFVAGWGKLIMVYLRLVPGIRYEIRGRENLPPGPKLFVCKHQSAWETIVFLLLNPDSSFVLKKELLDIPLYGWAARRAGNIPVDRSAGARALRSMAEGARKAVAEGRDVVIFPEGTRTPVGQAGKYHPGVMALYANIDAPVIPVAVNSGLFWGRNAFSKRPGKIILDIMPPIERGLARKEFMARLSDTIETRTRLIETESAPDKT